jgi:hypothetical protein
MTSRSIPSPRSRRWFVSAGAAVPAILNNSWTSDARVSTTIPATHREALQPATPEAIPGTGRIFTGTPNSIFVGNHIHLFGRGSDRMLYHTKFDGTTWETWQAINHPDIPMNVEVEPVSIHNGESLLIVWCAENGNANYWIFDGLRRWSSPASDTTIEGYFTFRSRLTLALFNNAFHVFATTEHGECTFCEIRSNDQRVIWDYIDASWSAVGSPSVAVTEDTMTAYWTAEDGSIYQAQFVPSSMEGWEKVK